MLQLTLYQVQEAIKNKKIIINHLNGKDNPDEVAYGSYFAYLMCEASCIFAYHMMLGGHYTVNQEDKQIILEHLRQIEDVVHKYDQH